MITAQGKSTYGHDPKDWRRAMDEAIFALRRVARDRGSISYSDLTTKIDSIRFEAEEKKFHDFLGQVSIEEDEAGRGMLSTLVVHKTGDRMPGPGFFELGSFLGRDVTDKIRFWVSETERVYEAWAK